MGQVAVLPPFDVGTAFTLNNAQWFTGGDGAWGLDVSNYAAGGSSLRSSPLGDNKTSVLQAYMEGPAQLEAYVLVDSEANFDHLVVVFFFRIKQPAAVPSNTRFNHPSGHLVSTSTIN